MSEAKQETKKTFCNTCKVFTNQLLRTRYSRIPFVAEEGRYGPEEYEIRTSIWSCAGCEEETVERQMLYSGEEEWDEFFPTREADSVQGKFFQNLTPELKCLYAEVIHSYNTGSLLLCTIGLRALVEGICADKDIEGVNLKRENQRPY